MPCRAPASWRRRAHQGEVAARLRVERAKLDDEALKQTPVQKATELSHPPASWLADVGDLRCAVGECAVDAACLSPHAHAALCRTPRPRLSPPHRLTPIRRLPTNGLHVS